VLIDVSDVDVVDALHEFCIFKITKVFLVLTVCDDILGCVI